MSTIEIPEGVTHWSCARLNKATGAYEKLLWGADGRIAVGSWKVPSDGEYIPKRVLKRWGAGMYKVFWIRTKESGKKEGAGHVEFRIEEPAAAAPPPLGAPPGYPPGAYPPGYPPPGMPAPLPYGAGQFDPLAGFRTLFEYAGNIRGQERDDARTNAERYRIETQAALERERMAQQERQAALDRMQAERDAMMRREHELAIARVQAELQVTREQIDRLDKRDKTRDVELLERLDDLQAELEEAKSTGQTVGQQALAMLQGVIDKVGAPLGEAAATAIKNGALKGKGAA